MGFLSDLVVEIKRRIHDAELAKYNGSSITDPWRSLFGENGSGAGLPLGTAQWLEPEDAAQKFGYPGSTLYSDRFWIGEALNWEATGLGYVDDRHVCLVSGSRGGKGTGVIVPNLCFWAGSSIVVDPKGENATVTARRRGRGSEYTHGLGQKVCILDPFGEVPLAASLKARYNPLDAIDPKSDLAVDDAGRVAAALVVVQSQRDPYWEEAAQSLTSAPRLSICKRWNGCSPMRSANANRDNDCDARS